jgi:hypothetical protein
MKKQGGWIEIFIYRKEIWKTTWKFRLLLIILMGACFFLTRGFISEKLAESLVCQGTVAKSDAVIIENFDPNYLLFEETAKLVKAGQVGRVYVPVRINSSGSGPNKVNLEFVEVMCSISRISEYELIPITDIEPIRLNAAQQIKTFLRDQKIHSITVVSPVFSSRRSFLVYHSVFESTGIKVYCLPVFNQRTPKNWTESWHGIQDVFMEFGKLWYYRLAVL